MGKMRLGETYLIAAEAAGRKGDFDLAAKYLNVIRERAAWAEGEEKAPQYWNVEGGMKNNVQSTYKEIEVTKEQLAASDFVSFMLDERGRELLVKDNIDGWIWLKQQYLRIIGCSLIVE